MAKLQYKTRADSAPRGKSRVYFSCHPEDFPKYFEKVSDLILSYQNCAVWYDAEPEIPFDAETMETDLSQVQLFVMPITERLLSTENRARDAELRFAGAHHIPILPLLYERGLDSLFAEYFGDLQYLDPNDTDPTAIPFSEKLERYLQSVLVSDTLAEKIRAAFDAYIFLSYRKKDRKYAQELMRLIHSNDFCRDIAIWYDEFLVPGESFNNAIEEALQKSELFTLVVTPNLVNERNYIMETEYPLAREARKEIVPLELCKTDRTALERLYDAIPPCTDARDGNALSDRLLRSLRTIALRENDSSPMHLFFIGLAYFGGIDVEVDRERGIGLIRAAAEADLPEAVEKMVSVYRSGEGVERDYLLALDWQRRLVDIHESLYRRSLTEETGEAYASALYFYAHYLYELGKFADASKVHERLEAFSRETANYAYATTYLHLSFVYRGRIAQAMNDVERAVYFLRESVSMSERLNDEHADGSKSSSLALSYHGLAFVLLDAGRYEEAIEYENKSLNVVLGLCARNGEDAYVSPLHTCYDFLGDLMEASARYDEAESYYRRAYSYLQKSLDSMESDEAKRYEHAFCTKLGNLYLRRGDVDGAEKYYDRSFTIRKELAERLGTVTARRELAVSYACTADIYTERKQYEKAIEHYLRSAEISRLILEEAEIPRVMQDLAVAYGNLGYLFFSCERTEQGLRSYGEALALNLKMLEKHPSLALLRSVAQCYGNFAYIYTRTGDSEKARSSHEQALRYAERAAAESDSLEDDQRLCEILLSYCDFEKRLERYSEAERLIGRAVSVVEAQCEKRKNVPILDVMARIRYHEGDLCSLREDRSGAIAAFEAALAVCDELETLDGGIRSYAQYVNFCCRRLLMLYRTGGEYEEAERVAGRLVRNEESRLRVNGIPEVRQSLASACESLADIQERRRQPHARDTRLRTIELRRQLLEELGGESDRFRLAIDLDQLGKLEQREGERAEALAHFREAEQISAALYESGKTEHLTFRAVVLYHIGRASDGADAPDCLTESARILEMLLQREDADAETVNKAVIAYTALAEYADAHGDSAHAEDCRLRIAELKGSKNGCN